MENLQRTLELKVELDKLRPLSENDQKRVMDKLRLDWNFHSSHIEGNSLTFGETKALLLHGITAQGKPLRDHFEIQGHNDAINWVLDLVKGEHHLSEKFIRELHKLILKEPYEEKILNDDGIPSIRKVSVGEYKKSANHVTTSTGEILRFSTPEETPGKMTDLLNWFNDKVSQDEVNPVLLAVEFHHRFILVHPFDDGNGRTVRILMNFILMMFDYPPAVIKTERKEEYLRTLRIADGGDVEPFADFVAENVNRSLKIMIAGAKGENIEEEDDLDKELAILEQRVKAVGRPIQVIRSGDTMLLFTKHILTPLVSRFGKKCDKLKHLYSSTRFNISFRREYSDHQVIIEPFNYDDSVFLENQIGDYYDSWFENQIDITYSYGVLLKENVDVSNVKSQIHLKLLTKRIEIHTSDKLETVSKLYDEQLVNREIDRLVNHEIRLHTEIIEQGLNE